MTSDPPNPHDALFRKMLANVADAASELRVASPKAVAEMLDWGALERVDGSMVPKDLCSRYSDLTFRTRTLADGRTAFLYLLMEHQSSPDPLMAFRMLEYVVGLIRKYLPDCPTSDKIPAVIPYTVHVGPKGAIWNSPQEVGELFDLTPAAYANLRDHLPRMRYILDDINAIDVPTLLRRPLSPTARITLLSIKARPGAPDTLRALQSLSSDFARILAAPGGKEAFDSFVTYYMVASKLSAEDLDRLGDRLGPDAKEVIVTTAEKFEARGEARGEVRGHAKMLLGQLTDVFGPLEPWAEQTVHAADIDQLAVWGLRVRTATSVAEVLA